MNKNKFFIILTSILFLLFTFNIMELNAETKVSNETEIGTGWSSNNDPILAANEALKMALSDNANKQPDFIIVYASAGSEIETILYRIREIVGKKTQIYGGTSDPNAVMNDKQFINIENDKKGLVLMTISSNTIQFKVGAEKFNNNKNIKKAAKNALKKAIKQNKNKKPDVIFITQTLGNEEEVLAAIEKEAGKNTIILGGSAAGSTQSVIGNKIYNQGVSLACLYTDLEISWVFKGAFEVDEKKNGIITKMDNKTIMQIDNNQTLDIYDKWLDGKINNSSNIQEIRDLMTLNPLCRKYETSKQTHYLFSHPWPADEKLIEKGVMTGTKILEKERVFVGHSTRKELLNSIGQLPFDVLKDKNSDGNKKIVLGIGIICAGVMGVIPPSERIKMKDLINNNNQNAPFIVNFTWGEQGHLNGVGNKHANLSLSYLVIME